MIFCKHPVMPVSNRSLASTAPTEIGAEAAPLFSMTAGGEEAPTTPLEAPSYTTLPEAIQQLVDRY